MTAYNEVPQTQIAELLAAAGVSYSAVLIQKGAIEHPTSKDGRAWEHDAWEISFTRSGRNSLRIPFRTGIGLRKAVYIPGNTNDRSAFARRQREVSARPVAPHPADVLHSLVCDDTHGESFADWAANFGYDEDSRRAMDTYLTCQHQTDDARRFFGAAEFADIGAMLQDY